MIVWFYELVTAPSYIHTRRCRHASRLPRSSHIHDHQGAYARAYTTIQCIFIVNPCHCSAPLSASQLQSTCNNRTTVQTTTNINRTQVHCEHHQNNTCTDPNIHHTTVVLRCSYPAAVHRPSTEVYIYLGGHHWTWGYNHSSVMVNRVRKHSYNLTDTLYQG